MKPKCREVAKAVKSKRARVVIVAPNIEHIQTEGGLDDLLTSILAQAEELGIPVVFALSRKKLGQVQSSQHSHAKHVRRELSHTSVRGGAC